MHSKDYGDPDASEIWSGGLRVCDHTEDLNSSYLGFEKAWDPVNEEQKFMKGDARNWRWKKAGGEVRGRRGDESCI